MSIALSLVACGGGGSADSTASTTTTSSTITPSSTTTTSSTPATPNSYTIGVEVSGLSSGSVVLHNNGRETLTVSANSSATFATSLSQGAGYSVTVETAPTGHTCTVGSGTGTVTKANVTGIDVTCSVHLVGTTLLGVKNATTVGYSVATDASGDVYVAGTTGGALDGNTLTGSSDFYVTKYDSSGVKQYTKLLGATGQSNFVSLTTDVDGNVYVAGTTYTAIDGVTKAGLSDFFVTKYNSSGTNLYTKLMGVPARYTYGRAVATDSSGNVYVTGYTTGNLDGIARTGYRDFFVTKYNSSGVKQYTKLLGVAKANTEATSVATDSSGNVYVVGTAFGALDGIALTGITDFFVTKYNSSGELQYVKQLGVAGKATTGASVATDADGNVYVSGTTYGALDGIALTGTSDFFVTKYDGSGVKQFTRLLGVAGANTQARSVATDSSGNVYVAGIAYGALDGIALTGTTDFFVTKYDSNGVKQYTKLLGVKDADTSSNSVATDKVSGHVYVAGTTAGALDGITKTGATDFFVTKYDRSGVKK